MGSLSITYIDIITVMQAKLNYLNNNIILMIMTNRNNNEMNIKIYLNLNNIINLIILIPFIILFIKFFIQYMIFLDYAFRILDEGFRMFFTYRILPYIT